MGFMKNMFAQLEKEVGNVLAQSTGDSSSKPEKKSGAPPTRWEKAVVGLDKIVVQVIKVDPDGIDVVCFGGDDEPEWYRNIKNTKGLEEMVTDKSPGGKCTMGAAMSNCIKDAYDKDMTQRPVAILVLTAGRPDDADELDATLLATVEDLAQNYEKCPLSITFVQIGNDSRAESYLSHLDGHIQAECAATGETFDLVDTIKDEDIQAAMAEIKGTKSTGTSGALIGAFAGAALGVGGMYIYNKQQAKKRTEGWGGKWKVSYDGEEISILEVDDDKEGNLVINGFPSGEETIGTYSTELGEDDEDAEYTISFTDPEGDWEIEGTVEDEHAIVWSDGTRWDELPQDGASFGEMAGAAAGGAALAGATGYLLDKKFFNKASKKDQCNYIILMDRSAKMAVVDY